MLLEEEGCFQKSLEGAQRKFHVLHTLPLNCPTEIFILYFACLAPSPKQEICRGINAFILPLLCGYNERTSHE